MFRNALIDVVVALVVLELTAMAALTISPWFWGFGLLAAAWPVWSEQRRERRRRMRAERARVMQRSQSRRI